MERLTLLLFTLFFTLSTFAQTDAQKILVFDSEIIVNENASIDVTETISVSGAPTPFIRKLPLHTAANTEAKYKITQVLLNNVASTYRTATEKDELAVYIERKETTPLPLDIYTIQYHVDNAASSTKDVGILNWNVTSNAWTLPIYKVDADITLPDHTTITQFSGFTGTDDKKKQGYYAKKTAPNKLTYSTTQPLMPKEALIVTLSWQKEEQKISSILKSLKAKISSTINYLFHPIA